MSGATPPPKKWSSPADAEWTFAAPGCDIDGWSESGQPHVVRVTITGNDSGNVGVFEAEFDVRLLGDVNVDGTVNVLDRSIVNTFWQTGSAGHFMLRDVDLNCDGEVNVTDRSIVNAAWQGTICDE